VNATKRPSADMLASVEEPLPWPPPSVSDTRLVVAGLPAVKNPSTSTTRWVPAEKLRNRTSPKDGTSTTAVLVMEVAAV
jgi:hypothetical protein